MLADAMLISTVAVTDLGRARRFFGEQLGLLSRDVPFDEYEQPKTTNFIAQIGPARGAWFKDPDGNVLGLRAGPIPGAG